MGAPSASVEVEKLVLEQVAERRRLKQRVVMHDIAKALNKSVGSVWAAFQQLEKKKLLKDQACAVVEVGPAPTPAGLEVLRKAG